MFPLRFLIWPSSLLTLLVPAIVGGQGNAPAPVVTAPVIQRSLAAKSSYIANVYPHRRATIGSAVDGRVEQFPINAGDEVQQGDMLAQLRTATVTIERDGAVAQRELFAAELKELENGSREEEKRLAEAQLTAAEAAARYNQSRFERAERLFSEGAGISQEEFELARSQATGTMAEVEQARNQLELVRQGPRPERIAQARARLEMQNQMVLGIEDRIKKYTLKAPFAGFVARELTEVGAWVKQGDPVAEVIEIDPVKVIVSVPAANIGSLRVGADCDVRVEAFPNRQFTGKIAAIVPEGDLQARSFPVHIEVDNPREEGQYRLLPGMLASVALPAGDVRLAWLVPKDGLNLAGSQAAVMKIVDGKAVAVPVEKGESFGGLIRVRPLTPDSLKSGDAIVVRGNERLRPGQPVQVRETIDPTRLLDRSTELDRVAAPPIEPSR